MNEPKTPFATIEEAAEEIRQGRMIVLVDDEDRENEGDLTMAAEKITPDAINFMTKYGGVMVRAGQTEASVDLARIAGLDHSGVICEIMNDDGSMARVPQLIEFCKTHGLKLVTVADLIRYRMQHERHVKRIAESILPTLHGDFRMIAYSSDVDNEMHVALVRGELAGDPPPLVRVH